MIEEKKVEGKMARRLIPFKLLPGSWGLKGKTFEKAKAEYELEGDELSIKLAEIEYGADSKEVSKLKVFSSFNKKEIDDYTKESKLNEIINAEDENKKAKETLSINFKHHKITENEYQKELATLNKEPWVAVTKIEPNKENPVSICGIELDWNDLFIEKLKENGFKAASDYLIVESWFNLLCSAIASENGVIDGTQKNIPGIGGFESENGIDLGDGRREYR